MRSGRPLQEAVIVIIQTLTIISYTSRHSTSIPNHLVPLVLQSSFLFFLFSLLSFLSLHSSLPATINLSAYISSGSYCFCTSLSEIPNLVPKVEIRRKYLHRGGKARIQTQVCPHFTTIPYCLSNQVQHWLMIFFQNPKSRKYIVL